ncbi:MAG: hypothetical protein K2O45_06770 [Oscillospiraceae bacterium]|nr:hypothetical protein [Oscillospiraceae bacterium]
MERVIYGRFSPYFQPVQRMYIIQVAVIRDPMAGINHFESRYNAEPMIS